MTQNQEIRFAVVMYGGVSLCIYINGVAQELLRLVRSTSGADISDDPVTAIYKRLSERILDVDHPVPGQPVPTRFVVDLLSGTSAGGINAVFLAKALAVRAKNLDVLRDTWLRVADMAQLLNSQAELFSQKRSLLRGQWMYEQLLDAFNDIDKPQQCDPAATYDQVREIDLFVTNTDLKGVQTPMRISDQELTERIHKGSFHFRFDAEQFADRASADNFPPVNHFAPEFNPLLAFAARCTSSFPIAFPPMRFRDIETTIGATEFAKQAARFRRFFHWVPLAASPGSVQRSIEFDQRPLADGGYLDNKPFGHVIDALTYRATDRKHSRKLLFVDPFPERQARQEDSSHIDFLTNARLAAMDLPRYETIRGDIERILQGNQARQRLKSLQTFLEKQVQRRAAQQETALVQGQAQQMAPENVPEEVTAEAEKKPARKAFRLPLSEMMDRHGPSYGTYHIIRVDSTTDQLARTLSLLAGSASQEDLFLAIRYVAAEWRKDRFSPDGDEDANPKLLTESEFLSRFDYSFRLRLILHLLAAANENENCPPEIRRALIAQLIRIRRCARRFCEIGPENPLHSIITNFQDQEGQGGSLTWDDLKEILRLKSERDRATKAREMYIRFHASIDSLADQIQEHWRDVFIQNYNETREILAKFPELKAHYKTFDFRDMLSMTYLEGSEVREHAPVEVHRVSPDDGIQLRSDKNEGKKLAGYAVADFGAFLHRPWRENDILWGRLDAASQIVCALLPHESQAPERQSFTEDLYSAIVQQEAKIRALDDPSQLASFTQIAAKDLADVLASKYQVPPAPPNHQLLGQLASASQILGRMIEEDLGQKGSPALFLKTVGGALAGIVAFLTPSSMWEVFTQYWLQLIGALGLTLWLTGSYMPEQILSDSAAALLASLGRTLFFGCIGVWALFQVLGSLLATTGLPNNPFTRILRWALVLLVVIVLGVGIWKLPDFLRLVQNLWS